jgi:thiol-disulfide isomerase/thioredoxin
MNVRALSLVALALATSTALGLDDLAKLNLVPKGAMSKIGYYVPQRVTLSKTKPATLTKEPEGLSSPLYGTLPMAGTGKAVYHVIVDEPEGKSARLFVDANGNGDLTDDPGAEWAAKEAGKTDDDKPLFMCQGGAMVDLGAKGAAYEVHVAMYRFDKTDPKRAALKDVLLYYRDYATEGEATIGGKSYKVMLTDNLAAGDFRGAALDESAGDKADSGVKLLVDVNGNGKFDSKGESFDVRKPFNIGGTTYELADLGKDGLGFKVVKSSKSVEEVLLDPDLSEGKAALAFEAKAMDGKAVKFPGDYKGKVVLVDFWATWCGPCMREVPNVVGTYEKYHAKGFEILGITLDNENAEAKIKSVTDDKRMTWTQVYDGKGWSARIADMYGIHSIPRAILVDGDSGKIIAGEVRGENLGKAVEKALTDKNKH